MPYSNEQIALKSHIERENAKTQLWIDADAGRWATITVDSLDHWAENDVYTIAQYEHYQAVATHYDYYKDVNGIRPRWIDYTDYSTSEIESMISALADQVEDEFAYDSWLEDTAEENHRYNDMMNSDIEPTVYELMAETAGY